MTLQKADMQHNGTARRSRSVRQGAKRMMVSFFSSTVSGRSVVRNISLEGWNIYFRLKLLTQFLVREMRPRSGKINRSEVFSS